MTMIECVARAIAGAHCGYPDTWGHWVEEARAAIEAMREPTETMLKSAFVAMNETPSRTWKTMKAEGVTPRRLFDVKMAPRYRAMIAGALA